MTPPIIENLCERFTRNRDTYHSSSYNEAQLRQEFLNPFFKALGWDMDNEQGYAEAYKDVVHEDSIRVEESAKAPDYCFRIGGTRKFFLEAKKPLVFVRDDPKPAYQLRRYAWSAKLPLSILTNFEEFAVYDCRWRPMHDDKPGKHRIHYFKFEEYAAKWDEIASVFSRDAILKGSFDKYAQEQKGKRGTQGVDDEFLQDIELFRADLARNLHLRNKNLPLADLNFAVGKIIDRLLFLRVCEDRGIEEYGQIKELLKGDGVYARLTKRFHAADERYNSGLFHFKADKERKEQPDKLTPALTVDDKILKEIIKRLYYPESPYEFSVMPADILGQVYEQFLGKVIVKSGRTVDVEYKPEVKKAGGVYYTPTYIVDYIVRHTVGKLLEGKTPKEVETLRILDPACGSGSFLIGAYQYLLDWHLEQYAGATPLSSPRPRGETQPSIPSAKAGGKRPPIYQSVKGEWRLTLAERKRILLNNIYGVDIDAQAVEVTKLSLLLKVLEGESTDTVQGELKLRHHALPDLGNNIKCGNSLIGPDIMKMTFPPSSTGGIKGGSGAAAKRTPPTPPNKLGGRLSDEEIARINPFDWESEFPSVFKAGGFDAVIGNPPYVFGRDWKELGISEEQKSYFKKNYSWSPYQLDFFSIFMEKANSIVKHGGRVGQIVPNVWLTNTYSRVTRSELLKVSDDIIIATPTEKVFPKLSVDTLVYTLKRSQQPFASIVLCRISKDIEEVLRDLDRSNYCDGEKAISFAGFDSLDTLIPRLKNNVTALGEFSIITRGVHPYRIGGYGKSAYVSGPQIEKDIKERPYNSSKRLKSYRPFIYGKDLRPFGSLVAKDYIKYGDWLAEPRSPKFFEGERIYSRKILGDRLIATLETGDSIADQQVYISKLESNYINIRYILGLLCCKLMKRIIESQIDETEQDFPQIKVSQLRELPIRTINFSDKADKARHDKMVSLVEKMLEMNKRLPEVKSPVEKEKLERQIKATDRQIDELVYELYGLTPEEIAIVEGKT